jgi:hypothetical protein
MPIRTSRVVGHEVNVTVIADVLRLTGNGLAECRDEGGGAVRRLEPHGWE